MACGVFFFFFVGEGDDTFGLLGPFSNSLALPCMPTEE